MKSRRRVNGRSRSAASASKAAAIARARAIAPDLEFQLGSTPATRFRADTSVFGRLVEDHDLHRALLSLVEQPQARRQERRRLFHALVRELKAHAAAEEQALWSTVLRNPETTEDARHAVAEHKEIDDQLADLAARDMSSATWRRRFAALKKKYLHHIREEEQEQFVAAQKTLTRADTLYMRRVFTRRKKDEKADAVVEKKIKLKKG